jgi:hypothetical protein
MSDPIGSRRTFERLPGGGYVLALVDDGVRVEARICAVNHDASRRGCHHLAWHGARRPACSDLNLSSQTARTSRGEVHRRTGAYQGCRFDWQDVIDDFCVRVIEAERNATPTQSSWTMPRG